SPATWPRDDRGATRLLLIDRDSGARRDATARDLPRVLRPGDLLVVNDAATLPASLRARLDGPSDMSEETGDFEVRLTGIGDATWRAVLLGGGDWRTPTERRPPPPRLAVGARLRFHGPAGA